MIHKKQSTNLTTFFLIINNQYINLLCFCLVFAGCGSQKQSVATKGMQNLTARYNILFNANEILKESEQNIKLASIENYDQILKVYTEPNETSSQSEISNLDEVITKSNNVINEKTQSKYVDDAYFLIAKANYFKSSFFNAAEFLTYVINSYPKNKKLKLSTFTWKAKTLIALGRYAEAKENIDSAQTYLSKYKKPAAEFHAVNAQLLIIQNKYEDATRELAIAKKLTNSNEQKLRWTFILAQLQQQNGQYADAYSNYTSIVHSNAPFEMAFNANLNRLGINDTESNKKSSKIDKLRALLKDEKNNSLTDQIYYQIGKVYQSEGNLGNAVESYKISLEKSTKNTNQKGLTNLALAEIYLLQSDFINAKSAYDNALNSLPPTYPNYDLISKKASNLSILAASLSTIAREDTLQMLAKLPSDQRASRIQQIEGTLLKQPFLKPADLNNNVRYNNGLTKSNSGGSPNNTANSKFYFDNPIAVSQGYSDFKNKWGNRKLEDNWRRSLKSALEITSNSPINPDEVMPGNPNDPDAQIETKKPTSISLIKDLPLTPELMAASETKIANAYYDLGTYYHEILNDDQEAVRYFELLLKRVPDYGNKLAVYYNLYRFYQSTNTKKSLDYKNLLLSQYPNSPFAKVISDSTYNEKNSETEIAMNQIYNESYTKYTDKAYQQVFDITEKAVKQFNNPTLLPQLAYLNALAYGHLNKINEFEIKLKKIASDFPDDKLIVPLVLQHLNYITENHESLSKREFALLDNDYTESYVEEPVVNKPVPEVIIKNSNAAANPVANPSPEKAPEKLPAENIPTDVVTNNEPVETDPITLDPNSTTDTSPEKPAVVNPVKESEIFNSAESNEYYFVINVTDPDVNLSSSRFGVGQFNRANFISDKLKHQLKEVNNENQLIYVGVFNNRGEAENYSRNMAGLLKQIMKVPVEKYNYFIISKQNLDLLKDKSTIDKYLQFQQKTF